MDAEVLALITAAAAGVTNAAVNAVTMLAPGRPRYVAFILSLLVSVSASYGFALMYLDPALVFTRQVHATLVMTGILGGLGAGGLNYAQSSAETARTRQRLGSRIYNAGGKP